MPTCASRGLRPSTSSAGRLAAAQYHAMAPSSASLSRPLPSSITPCQPRMRFKPLSGLMRDPLNPALPALKRPSPSSNCEAMVIAATIRPSAMIGGRIAAAASAIAAPGVKPSSAARSKWKPARATRAMLSLSHGPSPSSASAPPPVAASVATSLERSTSPFLAASLRRLAVGAKVFSPALSSAISAEPFQAAARTDRARSRARR